MEYSTTVEEKVILVEYCSTRIFHPFLPPFYSCWNNVRSNAKLDPCIFLGSKEDLYKYAAYAARFLLASVNKKDDSLEEVV